MKFVVPVSCCFHMGGFFMSRLCCQWSARVVQVWSGYYWGVGVGSLLFFFLGGGGEVTAFGIH